MIKTLKARAENKEVYEKAKVEIKRILGKVQEINSEIKDLENTKNEKEKEERLYELLGKLNQLGVKKKHEEKK